MADPTQPCRDQLPDTPSRYLDFVTELSRPAYAPLLQRLSAIHVPNDRGICANCGQSFPCSIERVIHHAACIAAERETT